MRAEEKVNKNWYVIYVSSRQEKKVDEALKQKGIESYLPLVKTLRNWSDRKKIVKLPLLRGYVFVHINLNEKDKILQTRGVVNFVRSEGKTGRVRDEEIENLKQLVSLGYHLEVFVSEKKIDKGDKIKIGSGPLKNLEGVVMEERGENFFDIFVEGIGFNIRVKLPKDVLMKTVQ